VRTIVGLDQVADRRWFLPAVSVFPMADYVLPFLPNQMLLVALSMLQPGRWWKLALTFVLATAAGALLTALAVQSVGPMILEFAFGGRPDAGATSDLLQAIARYGLPALTVLAMLPWPPRTGVLVCAMAGLSPVGIGVAVGLGRLIPATAYAAIGAKSPHLLSRFRLIDRTMHEVKKARAQGENTT
jgi:hypothetical protein